MMEQRGIFYPEPTPDGLAWSHSVPDENRIAFRIKIISANMISRSQIGRSAFAIEQTNQGEKLVVRPPLSAAELIILSKVPFFRSILSDAISQEGLKNV